MACTILQKQIEHINGRKENIIIPNVAMRQIREQAQISSLSSSAGSDMSDIRQGASSNTSTTTQNDVTNASNIVICELCITDEWYQAILSCPHIHSDILRCIRTEISSSYHILDI